MGEAKRRKLLDSNFGKRPKHITTDNFTAFCRALVSPDVFIRDFPIISGDKQVQNYLDQAYLVLISEVKLILYSFMVVTFFEENRTVTSVVTGTQKPNIRDKQLADMATEINKYYVNELTKVDGDILSFQNNLNLLPQSKLPIKFSHSKASHSS